MTTPIVAADTTTPAQVGTAQAARRALRGFNAGLAIFGAGAAAVAATDAGVLWMFKRLRDLVDRYGWGYVPAEEVPPFGFLEDWGMAIDIAALLLYGLGFLVAMWHARGIAEAIGISDWTYRWGWTVASIFIPFVCLVRPWLGFAEIRRAILASAAGGRPTIGREFSAFTLLLGTSFFVCSGAVRMFGFELENAAAPDSSDAFYAYVDLASSSLLGMAAAQAIMLGIMLVYLLTIRSKAMLLADRIDVSAFD